MNAIIIIIITIINHAVTVKLGWQEILDPQKKDQPGPNGEKCDQYLTLMRDDLQIAQGDCVYLMRDFKRPARSSLRLVAFTSPDKMDIFRVEDLFKNSKWVTVWRSLLKQQVADVRFLL